MLAALFPGQGSHGPGDRDEVARLAPELLEQCIAAVGEDPFPRSGERTRFAQPAIFCTSLARWSAAELPQAPGAFAGHSLGELTALTAAGALSPEDGLTLVVERARLMDEADAGGMLVVRGSIEDATELAGLSGLAVANDNAPGQVILSGAERALDAAGPLADELGLRVVRLGVAGAFHSPLMAPAEAAFREVLEGIDFQLPTAPVWCCATAAPFTDPREQLAAALTSPVRWREVVLNLQAAGAERFADLGPSTVLDGLVRKIAPDAQRVKVLADVVA